MQNRWISLTSLAITGMALIVAIAVPYLQRETSELTITVVSKASLNPVVPDGFRPLISLSISGRPVEAPHYSLVEIANSGTRPLLAAAVEQPLRIKLSKGSIVSAEVISAKPDALSPVTRVHVDAVEIVPALLNPGDSFQLGIISAGDNPSFIAEGRIAGLRAISVTERSPTAATDTPAMRYVLAAALIISYAVLAAVGMQGTVLRRNGYQAIINPVAALVLSVFMAASSIMLIQQILLQALVDYPKWIIVSSGVAVVTAAQLAGQFLLVRLEPRIAD